VGLKKLPTWDQELRIDFTSCHSNSIPTPQINWEQIPLRVHDIKISMFRKALTALVTVQHLLQVLTTIN
jgi:hypothetical protein